MEIAGKAVCVFMLLIIIRLRRTEGESNWSLKANRHQGGKKGNVCRYFLLVRISAEERW